MELVRIIYESFGGRELERIFKNYLLISLLLKQLVFSIFSVPANSTPSDSVPMENEQISEKFIAADFSKEGLSGIQVFKLLWTLAQMEINGTTATKQL